MISMQTAGWINDLCHRIDSAGLSSDELDLALATLSRRAAETDAEIAVSVAHSLRGRQLPVPSHGASLTTITRYARCYRMYDACDWHGCAAAATAALLDLEGDPFLTLLHCASLALAGDTGQQARLRELIHPELTVPELLVAMQAAWLLGEAESLAELAELCESALPRLLGRNNELASYHALARFYAGCAAKLNHDLPAARRDLQRAIALLGSATDTDEDRHAAARLGPAGGMFALQQMCVRELLAVAAPTVACSPGPPRTSQPEPDVPVLEAAAQRGRRPASAGATWVTLAAVATGLLLLAAVLDGLHYLGYPWRPATMMYPLLALALWPAVHWWRMWVLHDNPPVTLHACLGTAALSAMLLHLGQVDRPVLWVGTIGLSSVLMLLAQVLAAHVRSPDLD